MYKYYRQHGDYKTITGHAVEESLTLDTMGINSMFSNIVISNSDKSSYWITRNRNLVRVVQSLSFFVVLCGSLFVCFYFAFDHCIVCPTSS
jgi:hypothetical protein